MKIILKLHYIIALATIFSVMTLVGGCVSMDNTAAKNMVGYINNKYPSDEFTYLSPYGGAPGRTQKEILVTSKLYPDAEVWVSLDTDEDGNKVWYDNYLYWKYKKESSDKLISFVNKVLGGDCYFLYSTTEHTSGINFTGSMTSDKYFSDKESAIGFIAVLPSTFVLDKSSVENNIVSNIGTDNLINFRGSIRFSSDGASYNELVDGSLTYSQYVRRDKKSVLLNFSVDDGKIDKFDWR